MRAFVTSIGEKTTELCVEQLKKFGFEVTLLSKVHPWPDKYREFIETTNEDCIRVDADVIVNQRVDIFNHIPEGVLMAQGSLFDFYQNDVTIGQPVFYSKEVFPILKRNLANMSYIRPETSMWRLAEVDKRTLSFNDLMGSHGFMQDGVTMEKAYTNKMLRKQLGRYDFDLAKKLKALL